MVVARADMIFFCFMIFVSKWILRYKSARLIRSIEKDLVSKLFGNYLDCQIPKNLPILFEKEAHEKIRSANLSKRQLM